MFYFRHFIHITNIEAMKSVCGDLILVNDTVTEGRVNGDSNFIRLIYISVVILTLLISKTCPKM